MRLIQLVTKKSRGSSFQSIYKYLAKNWPLYAMMVPALVLLVLFNYFPMYGIVMAFEKFNPGKGFINSPWVGLRNFDRLFTSPNFGQIMANTLIISVTKLASLQLGAVVLALTLNEIRSLWYKRLLQTVLYLPHFLSWIVLGGILVEILSQNGIVNRLVRELGFNPIIFLSNDTWFRPVVIFSHLWKEIGWSAIIYLAALTGIDPQLYEAAAMDGADRWKQTLHISLPGIRLIVVVMVILNLGSLLDAGFEQIFTLLTPGAFKTGDILGTYIYRQGIVSSQFGLAAAAGLMGSVISLFLISFSYWAAQKWGEYRIF